jgi:hypothetical protein
MLVEVEPKIYREIFLSDPHPFISEQFIELNKHKTGKVVRLIEDSEKASLGLVAGVKNGVIYSPFSAPFGGFHYRNEIVYISEIDRFIQQLKEYIASSGLKGIEITLPPDIYSMTFNAKTVNSLLREGFSPRTPDITNWVNLLSFKGEFSQKNSREYYRQSVRNGLAFSIAEDLHEKNAIYDLICENRAKFGRPIFMTFDDIMKTADLWPVDFFKVNARDGSLVSSAIFYRSRPDIGYAVFWGDNDNGRPLRAMDHLTFHLWNYYKELGYKYLDMGISTEYGSPNEGLLRYKEAHDSVSSPRFKFTWQA